MCFLWVQLLSKLGLFCIPVPVKIPIHLLCTSLTSTSTHDARSKPEALASKNSCGSQSNWIPLYVQPPSSASKLMTVPTIFIAYAQQASLYRRSHAPEVVHSSERTCLEWSHLSAATFWNSFLAVSFICVLSRPDHIHSYGLRSWLADRTLGSGKMNKNSFLSHFALRVAVIV